MITKPMIFAAGLVLALATSSCNNEAGKETDGTQNDTVATGRPVSLKEENLSYKADTITANGYVVYNDNQEGKRPAVLLVHEWWGQNDYVKARAKQLAEMATLPWQLICLVADAMHPILKRHKHWQAPSIRIRN
jgi:hypothetical protein